MEWMDHPLSHCSTTQRAQPMRWLPQQSLNHCTCCCRLASLTRQPWAWPVAAPSSLSRRLSGPVLVWPYQTVQLPWIQLWINNRLIPIRLSINEKIRQWHTYNLLCIYVIVAYLLQLVFFYKQIPRNVSILHTDKTKPITIRHDIYLLKLTS